MKMPTDTYSYWILKGIYLFCLCFDFNNTRLFIVPIDSGNISKIIDADTRHLFRFGIDFSVLIPKKFISLWMVCFQYFDLFIVILACPVKE